MESVESAAPVVPAPATPAPPPLPVAPQAPAPVAQMPSIAPQTSTPLAQAPPAAPARAPDELTPIPHGGLTIEELVAWLQTKSLSPEVVTAGNGERHLVIRIKNTPFNIFMRDGKNDRYQSLELAAGFSTNGTFDTSQLNDWNSNNRWTRSYYDDVKDPWLEMDIDLWPGGTFECLNDQLIAWLNTVARFIEKYSIK
jgi:Putative bacterial sensory transduction regulator